MGTNLIKNWLSEKMEIHNRRLRFDYGKKADARSASTSMGKGHFQPLLSHIDGHEVFSVYPVVGGSRRQLDILRTIKGIGVKGTGIKMEIDAADYRHFIDRTAVFIAGRILAGRGIDTILYPKSSSALLRNLVSMLAPKWDVRVMMDDSFKSTDLHIVDSPHITPGIHKRLEQFISRAQEAGHISMKSIPPMYRKFIGGFLSYQGPDMDGRSICVIDDILTSGTTMSTMFRATSSAKCAIGVTMFKVM